MVVEVVPTSNLVINKTYYLDRNLSNYVNLPLQQIAIASNSSGGRSSYFCNQVSFYNFNPLNGSYTQNYNVSQSSQFLQLATYWSSSTPNQTIPP